MPGESASAAAASVAVLLEPESPEPELLEPEPVSESFDGATVAESSLASGTASLPERSDAAGLGERPTIVLSLAAEVTPRVFGTVGAAEGTTSPEGAAGAGDLLEGVVVLVVEEVLPAESCELRRELEESFPPLLLAPEPLPSLSDLASGFVRTTVSG